ncbi:helix-turn-helix transcriptional regulator [Streptacidiphilus cavernicola]|uniref:Helix-turn-helix transcriptional regulator n=1 Tax=Streptacidiphilus cavernicola TaxID=3342716 RepID=A0ABV6VWL1_9ACTN
MSRAQERPRQAEVLDTLRNADAALGVAEVADRIGIHVNTARFHLDALVAAGTVVRTLEQPSGPGRPRTVYSPQPGMDRGGSRSYRLLARILLGHLSSTGPDAVEAAGEAGRAWGRFLADGPEPFQRLSGEEAAARLTALLDDLGFAPQPEPDTSAPRSIRLRHCPFLELAEEHGPLVCRIHLGLMQGALTELRAPLTASRLEPFAEPDACLVHLEHADAA